MSTWESAWPGRGTGTDSLASRIGVLRTAEGMTQQELADRIGVSRVAVSHLEAAINSPDARTVTLLASVFGMEPHDLVAGTDYPAAKADRLPLVVARRTEVAHQVAMMELDLSWVEGPDAAVVDPAVAEAVRQRWRVALSKLAATVVDLDEAATLDAARARLDLPRPS